MSFHAGSETFSECPRCQLIQAAAHQRARATWYSAATQRSWATSRRRYRSQRSLPSAGGDGRAGFVIVGIDLFDYSGVAATAAGDVNGDGIGEQLIGPHGADPRGRAGAGEGYVVFGRDVAQAGNFPAVFALATLVAGDGSAGFVLNGIDVLDYSGRSVSAARDVNGDGIGDLIMGAFGADADGRANAGESYVVLGRLAVDAPARVNENETAWFRSQ
jgi:hypothetical protein